MRSRSPLIPLPRPSAIHRARPASGLATRPTSRRPASSPVPGRMNPIPAASRRMCRDVPANPINPVNPINPAGPASRAGREDPTIRP